MWSSCDSRDENLSRDFICAQNTGYLTHCEGLQSASSQLIQLSGDKYSNNLNRINPEYEHV